MGDAVYPNSPTIRGIQVGFSFSFPFPFRSPSPSSSPFPTQLINGTGKEYYGA